MDIIRNLNNHVSQKKTKNNTFTENRPKIVGKELSEFESVCVPMKPSNQNYYFKFVLISCFSQRALKFTGRRLVMNNFFVLIVIVVVFFKFFFQYTLNYMPIPYT